MQSYVRHLFPSVNDRKHCSKSPRMLVPSLSIVSLQSSQHYYIKRSVPTALCRTSPYRGAACDAVFPMVSPKHGLCAHSRSLGLVYLSLSAKPRKMLGSAMPVPCFFETGSQSGSDFVRPAAHSKTRQGTFQLLCCFSCSLSPRRQPKIVSVEHLARCGRPTRRQISPKKRRRAPFFPNCPRYLSQRVNLCVRDVGPVITLR